MKKNIFIGLILVICFASCTQQKTIEANGFIVFDDPNHWHFVPVKSIISKNCIESFNTANLGKGLQFSPFSSSYSSSVRRTLDTLKVEHLDSGYPEHRYSLKISPVVIKYDINKKYIDLTTKTAPVFRIKIKGHFVEFNYEVFPIHIRTITPLLCYKKKSFDKVKCECKHQEGDSNDYLFKICQYLKQREHPSEMPCVYDIKGIENDTLNGKKVIRVDLTCCYLGDKAYFDPITKEIINFAYGAK